MRDEICECGHAAEIHRRLIKRTWCAGSPGDNKVPGTNCYCEQYKAVTPPAARPDTDGGDGDKDATLANLRIDAPEDIQHYGNNALTILSTTVATIKHVYDDPGSNMPDRVCRMEAAIEHLKKIIDQSSAQLAAEVERRERGELLVSRCWCEIGSLAIPIQKAIVEHRKLYNIPG